MHSYVGLSLKSVCTFASTSSNAIKNPRVSPSVRRKNFGCNPAPRCGESESPVGRRRCRRRLNSLSYDNGAAGEEKEKPAVVKDIDVATLGNLCVDIVLNVPELPPKPLDERKTYMEELSNSCPDKKYWEAGGNCNMAIAAARLGLRTVTIGHLGDEIYGRFLLDVLHDEGIGMVEMNGPEDVNDSISAAYETLVCWVLVDPLQRHGFCSRADFSEGPAFFWMHTLSIEVKIAIRRSKIIFCNGYDFDEFYPDLLVYALDYAIEAGTSIFFDPGPRGKSLMAGTAAEQQALDKYLRMSDVLLLTSDEAESLTGIEDPILAGKELLKKGIRTNWVIIKMGDIGSILINPSSISCAPAFKVDVMDTVGCGDSFVAAIAFGVIHKMPFISTLAIANAVGAVTAMGCGAGRNVASLKQVMELVQGASLNEDNKFWEELVEKQGDVEEVTLLIKGVDGKNDRVQHASLLKTVCDLLHKLICLLPEKVETC